MKRFAKIAIGAALLAGASTIAALPAFAAVRVGIGIAPYGAIPAGTCNPDSRFYDPYYCGGYPYYGPGFYSGPYVGFGWHGGFHGGGFHGGGSFHGGGHGGGGGHHR